MHTHTHTHTLTLSLSPSLLMYAHGWHEFAVIDGLALRFRKIALNVQVAMVSTIGEDLPANALTWRNYSGANCHELPVLFVGKKTVAAAGCLICCHALSLRSLQRQVDRRPTTGLLRIRPTFVLGFNVMALVDMCRGQR